MSKHLGDFDASTVIYGKFTTYRPSTGAPYTLGGTPALSVYKDNSTTQSTTGVTLTVDFDSVTGLHHFAIDTSADGTFYAAGSFFDIVITTGTVDSVSAVGTVVGSFTIRKNSALKPATAGRTLVVDSSGLADANTVKVGPSGSGTAQTARDIGASVLLSSGTGTGQLDFTSGVVKANVTQNAGSAITAASGIQEVKVASLATGAIDSTSFAAGAITATVIATDAIGSNELAATAASEIATAVRTELTTELARLDAAVTTRASQTSVDTVDDFLDTEIAAIKAKTDNLPASPAAVGSAMTLATDAVDAAALKTDAVTEIVTAIFANAPAESYATDGSAPTLAQFLYMIYSVCSQFDISSTTLTTRRLDGTTSAMTFTLDSASAPTSRTRAS